MSVKFCSGSLEARDVLVVVVGSVILKWVLVGWKDVDSSQLLDDEVQL